MSENFGLGERKNKEKKHRSNSIIYIFLLAAWIGLVCAGYWYATGYVERAVQEIQQTNALNIQMLEKEIESLRFEMNAIEEILAKTDQTLSHAGSASEAVNERISELDEQLKKLEKSLNILMESGNEDY